MAVNRPKGGSALSRRGLLFGFGWSVTSDAEEKVPTGRRADSLLRLSTRTGSDFLLLCRSSPVGDVRRDLIGAWHRPQQALSAGCLPRSKEEDETDDGARRGHAQALAHDRRGFRGDRRNARREDGGCRGPRLRGAADLGTRARRRAGLGARGLPACRRLL